MREVDWFQIRSRLQHEIEQVVAVNRRATTYHYVIVLIVEITVYEVRPTLTMPPLRVFYQKYVVLQ